MTSPYKRYLDVTDSEHNGKKSRSDPTTPTSSQHDEDTPMEDHDGSEDIILLGMLCNIPGRACSVKDYQQISFQSTGTADSDLTPLKTRVGKNNSVLKSDCDKKLVYLNSKTHVALQKMSYHDVSYTALTNLSSLMSALAGANESHHQKSQAIPINHEVQVDLLVSCASHLADSVARTLAKCMLFLQHPHLNTFTHQYRNPQYLDIPGATFSAGAILPPLSKDLLDAREATKTQHANETSDGQGLDPSRLLDDLPMPKGIRAIEADDRIRTKLLDHQKEGVDFVTRRERLDLPQCDLWRRDASRSLLEGDMFLHRITGARRSSMEDFRGGLLADDMGLGKTLTMIAALVCTLSLAEKHAETSITNRTCNMSSGPIPVKTTLVLVPSALLMDVWATELEQHVQPGTLKTYQYHGPNRHLDQSTVLPYDIVVSTYATVASDFRRGGGVLSKFTWYRLILDEAHVVRNWSTKQFGAVDSIAAAIRWCLTGTPIQNSVDDLGSLIKLLRVPIFCDATQFRKYISGARQRGSMYQRPNVPNMKLMLTSICLRRHRGIIALPGVQETVVESTFTRQERMLYDSQVEILRKSMTMETNRGPSEKGSSRRYVLESILRLRIFCNVGVVGDLEADQVFSLLQQEGETNCYWCDTAVSGMEEGPIGGKPRITHCCHVVCADCVKDVEGSRKGSSCPVCLREHEGNIYMCFGGDQNTVRKEPSEGRTWPSKLLVVAQKLGETSQEEKSIVFTFWRHSLDVLGQLLSDRRVPFLRIDGQIPPIQRKNILTEFGAKPSNRVLLMTLGTGAVGLNDLSVASRVHFLEPQWNPSVESQAMGRVIRLGQERECYIMRYIIKGSIEKSIQERQFIKLDLAAAGGLYSGPKAGRTDVDRDLWRDRLRVLQKLLKPREDICTD